MYSLRSLTLRGGGAARLVASVSILVFILEELGGERALAGIMRVSPIMTKISLIVWKTVSHG
ncbi:unnamed protein product [Ectocarpus sp. CCAP 1310/34]|nr:unnamed protein product [Ectocarpus sp. CCAP 1310/34]